MLVVVRMMVSGSRIADPGGLPRIPSGEKVRDDKVWRAEAATPGSPALGATSGTTTAATTHQVNTFG